MITQIIIAIFLIWIALAAIAWLFESEAAFILIGLGAYAGAIAWAMTDIGPASKLPLIGLAIFTASLIYDTYKDDKEHKKREAKSREYAENCKNFYG